MKGFFSRELYIYIPSRKLTYPPDVWHIWVDDFPFPQVGYVNFLGGDIYIYLTYPTNWCDPTDPKWGASILHLTEGVLPDFHPPNSTNLKLARILETRQGSRPKRVPKRRKKQR